MPRVNIYIRNADYVAWKAIEDKPGWLHRLLNPVAIANGRFDKAHARTVDIAIEETRPIFKMQQDKFMEFSKNPIPVSTNPFMEDIRNEINDKQVDKRSKLCQHYQTKGQCLVKGCK